MSAKNQEWFLALQMTISTSCQSQESPVLSLKGFDVLGRNAVTGIKTTAGSGVVFQRLGYICLETPVSLKMKKPPAVRCHYCRGRGVGV